MQYLYVFLGWVMNGCYSVCHNYGVAIVLFTFLSKIGLLPVALWTYFNAITMIKIQPEINMLKVKYYGQADMLAEEQAKLFKEKKYNPFASTIPIIIQLVLLIGVVGVIRQGMDNPAIDMSCGSVNLGDTPSQSGLKLLWAPLMAGLSAWLLSAVQNNADVLQSEQSTLNKYGMLTFSVGLSIYLGWFVPVGTALYWVCSNIMAVIQLLLLNAIIKPRRFVDYQALQKSREELASLEGTKKKSEGLFSENKRRERRDYKKFFSVVNKHLVFYSESSGFYKYFRGFIEYILGHTNIVIHYITSDPDDQIFELEKKNTRIRAYYIGENRLITLMMQMDADIVVMTMPDLENFHIKRSYIRKDIEYIHVQHGLGSINLTMRQGCVDHFDTIFCAGPHHKIEVLETEEVYHQSPKKLVEVGYPLIDDIRAAYNSCEHKKNDKTKILIAPSWQKDNIIDSCLEPLLEQLKDSGFSIIVRPHPQEVRLKKAYMDKLVHKYQDNADIEIQTDFTSDNPVMEADLLITDWSDISWEYAFTTLRPVIFINTPMKVMNPEYKKIAEVPLNILLRDKIGKSLDIENLSNIKEVAAYLLEHSEEYREQIDKLAHYYVYNLGNSGEVGAKYIIRALQEKIAERRGQKL